LKRPNIVLILADDLGFSDLGFLGSEIQTPNLDALAEGGVMLSAMYNCARCCPSRASLLTGLYPHNAGIGQMGANLGTPAYQGYLRDDAVTIAEVLQADGYRTLMAGKWHVGGDLHANYADQWQIGAKHHPTPRQRGFDRFYGIVDGVTHFFSPHYLMEDDARVTDIPDSFYFTDAITDKAIEMVKESMANEQPFFLYMAHTAPHWPLHALPEDIAKYDGVYNKGWDAIRTARHEEMLAKDVLKHSWQISKRDESAPAWGEVKEQDWEAHRMAVYAGMIDRMDQSIGRLIDTLKEQGQFENTLIMFLSDNGGCAEFMAEDGWARFFPNMTHDGRKIAMGNRPDLLAGDALTYMSYDLPWANVSNTPFRKFKHWVHEGGISTPLIAHWGAEFAGGQVAHAPCHLVDILPTILAVTGSSYLNEYNGKVIQPLAGESLMPMLQGEPWERQQPIYWEHEGNCAVRMGNFKLVQVFDMPWELYDMEKDRTELLDLSGKHKVLVEQLKKEYQDWADKAGVLDWRIALPRLQAAWGIDDIHGKNGA
jgi:arylsulfatase